MYHKPRMCRTCLQMSRGDFKFVSLDSADPLWESNSPNLKDQLIYLVPEMKLDSTGEYICTSCFIALRTAYEFKRMCQSTEKKFQNHNYKYRRPYGVGPGSSQFHVTLNENCNYQEMANFRCQNLNYLQTDTSIDITEHHLYDATKVLPRKQLTYLNNVTQKLPEIDVEVIVGEKNAEKPQSVAEKNVEKTQTAVEKSAETPQIVPEKVVAEKNTEKSEIVSEKNAEKTQNNTDKTQNNADKTQNNAEKIENITNESKTVNQIDKKEVAPQDNIDKLPQDVPKKLDSSELRKKYNIGSQISILKTQRKTVASTQAIIRMACEDVPYLKLNNIRPDALRCFVHLNILTQNCIKKSTSSKYTLNELQELANSYYLGNFDELLTCKFCSRYFSTKYWLQIHEEEHTSEKPFHCTHCNMQFVRSDSLEEHLKIHNKLLHLNSKPPIVKPPAPKVANSANNVKEEKAENLIKTTDANIESKSTKEVLKPATNTCTNQEKPVVEAKATTENVIEPVNPETPDNTEHLQNDVLKADTKTTNDTKDPSNSDMPPKKENTETEAELKQTSPVAENDMKRINSLKMVKYYTCLICSKICRGEIQLYQHCKFVHVPNITSSNYWSNFLPIKRMAKKTVEEEVCEEDVEEEVFEEDVEEEVFEEDVEEEAEERFVLRAPRSVNYANALTPYKCNICGKGFGEENFLNLHMYVHTPTILSSHNVFTQNYESEVFTCYLCNKGFAKERYLKLHNLHVHLSKTTVCKICNREFKSDFWFSRHRCNQPVLEPPDDEDDDDETKPVQCNFCNRKFARLRFMKSHRKRMHKHLMKSGIKIKTKYLTNRTGKEQLEIDNLELDVDPMKLYTISGASSFDDEEEEDVIEIPSGSEEFSNESSIPSHAEEVERQVEDDGDQRLDILVPNKIEHQYKSIDNKKFIEGINANIVNQKELAETEEMSFNASEITVRRKSIVRSTPKLQCDFCGEYIEESRYDNHIYEHNNMRLQKSSSARKTEHNYSYDPDNLDNNQIVLKCHICFKSFKRKFNLMTHMNRHVSGEDSQQSEGEETRQSKVETENCADENETSQKEPDVDDTQYGQVTIINGIEVYECCGKTFKLKAHFYRHFKIRHPRSICKPKVIEKKPDELVAENQNTNEDVTETLTSDNAEVQNPEKHNIVELKTKNDDDKSEEVVTNRTRYITRKSISDQTNTNLNETAKNNEEVNDSDNIEEINKDSTISQSVSNQNTSEANAPLTSNNTNKRKLHNQTTNEEVPNKKQRVMKRGLSDAEEVVARKRIKTNTEEVSVTDKLAAPVPLNDIEFLPVDGKPFSGKYECNVCDKRFKQKCQLRDHFNVHTGDKPYKCDFCSPVRGFTQSSSLYVHFRRVHAIVTKNCLWEVYSKNGSCLICSTVFEKHAIMFRHMREYYAEKDFQCHICTKKFNMFCHFLVHDIDPKEMQVTLTEEEAEAEATTDQENEEVEQHLKSKVEHTTGKRSKTPGLPKEGTCDSDTATSSNDDKLSGVEDGKNVNPEHLRCTKCDKLFPDKQQLRFHKKSLAHIQQVQSIKKQLVNQNDDGENNADIIVKKIKRHQCPMCDLSFVRKVQLKKHKKKCHRKRNANKKQNLAKNISNIEPESIITSNTETLSISEAVDTQCTTNNTILNDESSPITASTGLALQSPECDSDSKESQTENSNTSVEHMDIQQQTAATNEESQQVKLKEEHAKVLKENSQESEHIDADSSAQIPKNDSDENKVSLQSDLNEEPIETGPTFTSTDNSECPKTNIDASAQIPKGNSDLNENRVALESDLNEERVEMDSTFTSTDDSKCPKTDDIDADKQIPKYDSKSDENKSLLQSDLNEQPEEISNTSTPTDDNYDCPETIFDVDKPQKVSADEKSVEENCPSEPEMEQTNVHSSENNSSQELENVFCNNYDQDSVEENCATNESSIEKEPAMIQNTDFNLAVEKPNIVGSSDSSFENLETVGLSDELINTQPKAVFNDQNLEYPKSISNINEDVGNKLDHSESLKTVSECVELNK